jgi:spore coat protein U-like protein
MKKIAIWTLALGLVLASVGSSLAADTATINVQATVLGSCSIQSAPALMDWGSIDPATYVTTALAGSVVFRCTTGVPYSINFADPVTGEMPKPAYVIVGEIVIDQVAKDSAIGRITAGDDIRARDLVRFK